MSQGNPYVCEGKYSRYFLAFILGSAVHYAVYKATDFKYFPGGIATMLGLYVYRSTACDL